MYYSQQLLEVIVRISSAQRKSASRRERRVKVKTVQFANIGNNFELLVNQSVTYVNELTYFFYSAFSAALLFLCADEI